MKLTTVLTHYLFPEEVQAIFAQSNIMEFFPPQAEAIDKGALEGKSLLMSVPTAAGKTLIAELCMLKSIFQQNGRCLYIVPLKALASEKYEEFKQKYSSLGVKINQATGDYDTPLAFLSRADILIATAEKVDSLLRTRTGWLINSLNVVILDEIHYINDGTRGPTLEILTARIKQLNPRAQILALSATISNAPEIADWLKAELVKSDWRPIPLKEGVYFNEEIQFTGSASRLIKEEPHDDLSKLTLDTLRGKGQVLIFVNSRRSSQAASRQISGEVYSTLNEKEKKQLQDIAKEIVGSNSDATKICQKLGEVIRCGVAFHHAGLKPKQRKLIEDSFKQNFIKVICSTPTLAAGVNLPARRAIIRDIKRYEDGLGSSYIPISEYKQCAGRAGRPQYDKFGEAVLIAKSYSESRALFERYINASPEPVVSKLGQESALRIHILSSIAGGYVHDINDTFEFISQTFFAHQRQTSHLIEMIGEIFDFLQKEEFIEKSGFRYYATTFGQCTSRLYIDPLSSIVIRVGLKKLTKGKSFSNTGLLHLISCCPDSPHLKFSKSEIEGLETFASNCQDEFILNFKDLAFLDHYFLMLSILKTTMLLSYWIEEEREEIICDEFGIGPGDVYRHIEAAQWLIHASLVFADLWNYKNLTFQLAKLQRRIQYGIKDELLELTQLKGIGRIRARQLFNKGFKKISDLKFTTADQLAQIPHIGKTLALNILEQITGKIRKKYLSSYSSEVL